MRPTSYSLGNNTGGTKQFNWIGGMNAVVEMNSNERMDLTLESLRMKVVESLRKVLRRGPFHVDGVKFGNVTTFFRAQ